MQQFTGIEKYEDAWDIMKSSAVMMMRHDEPEKYSNTFHAANPKTYRMDDYGDEIQLYGEGLYTGFMNNRIDTFSLSPRQLMDLLLSVKGRAGNKRADSIYGLEPEFEGQFRGGLESMMEDETPMFEMYTKEDSTRLKRIKLLSELAYWADMSDMICPYTDQIMRTLRTQYSRDPGSFQLFCRKIILLMQLGSGL